MSLRARRPLSFASRGLLVSIALATALSVSVASNDARACGGCFHQPPPANPPPGTMTTLVSGHRMAVSISTAQTVLWDQVQYTGSPTDFAWVLPVRAGARLELSTDAWFEALDAATSTRVTSPALNCQGTNNFAQTPLGDDIDGGNSGCSQGCLFGADADDAPSAGDFSTGAVAGTSSGAGGGISAPPPVSIVHEGTVGPYETVTLHANDPDALPTWLVAHGYVIDPDVSPIIDAYTSEGFDFIALRLAPMQGVQQMKPVRVISPGASPTLPLRMVASGTGANVAITLFAIGEGRWEPQNFPGGVIDPNALSWDFTNSQSNYASLRVDALLQNEGRTWLSTFAQNGALLAPLNNPTTGFQVALQVTDGSQASTIADAYVLQGSANGEAAGSVLGCMGIFDGLASSDALVVDTCSAGSGGAAGAASASSASSSSGAGGAASASSTSGTGGSGGGASTSSAGGAGGFGGGTSTSSAGGAGGGECASAGPNQIAANGLACGTLDDVAVALTGMHPSSVWISRLEAQLPRAALNADLVLQAAPTQAPVSNWLTAPNGTNPPCPLASQGAAPMRSPGKPPSSGGKRRRDLGMSALALMALAIAVARRVGRARIGSMPVRA